MNKEIIEPLERAKSVARIAEPNKAGYKCIEQHIDQALDKLCSIKAPEQPPASEFTKNIRKAVNTFTENETWPYRNLIELCDRLDRAEANKVDLLEALEQSAKIFSKKLCSLRRKQDEACNLNFFVESNFWGKLYNQFFELRLEIERDLDKKNLNEFCNLIAFMSEEKREAAIAKAKKG